MSFDNDYNYNSYDPLDEYLFECDKCHALFDLEQITIGDDGNICQDCLTSTKESV